MPTALPQGSGQLLTTFWQRGVVAGVESLLRDTKLCAEMRLADTRLPTATGVSSELSGSETSVPLLPSDKLFSPVTQSALRLAFDEKRHFVRFARRAAT